MPRVGEARLALHGPSWKLVVAYAFGAAIGSGACDPADSRIIVARTGPQQGAGGVAGSSGGSRTDGDTATVGGTGTSEEGQGGAPTQTAGRDAGEGGEEPTSGCLPDPVAGQPTTGGSDGSGASIVDPISGAGGAASPDEERAGSPPAGSGSVALAGDGGEPITSGETGGTAASGGFATGGEQLGSAGVTAAAGVESTAGSANAHAGTAGDGGGADCPADMVPVGSFCVDRFEASRPDATAADPGQDESLATSRPGILPWVVNPMTATDLDRFDTACRAAGKRLCTTTEWHSACSGPNETTYVYGSVFDREVCNCVDTYCDDHCASEGIASGDCNVTANCGYAYTCFHLDPTGAHPNCTNEYGTYDINGNVWEAVPSSSDPRGFELRGGAFNCAYASARVSCTYNASWSELHAGFRCCRDRP